jgi:hypothetical protein
MVESIPGVRPFGIFDHVHVFQPRPDALGLPVPIAMRMNWKSEQDILTNPRCQIDQFGPGQLDLGGKVFNADWKNESLKATDAFQPEIYADFSRHEQAWPRRADIQRIFDRSQWADLIIPQLQDVCFFFAVEVNPFRRNLLEMYFHGYYLLPHTLPAVLGIRVGGSEETSCRLRRRVWQGEAPFRTGGTLKPTATGKVIRALADELLRQRPDNAVWHKRLNVAT